MLLKHTILYLPAQILGPLTQFLSVIVWTHWLSPAEFGVLILVTVTHELAFAVTLSGFSLYAVRHIPDRNDEVERRKFYNTEATMLAVSSLFSILVALVLLYLVLDVPPSALMLVATLVFFVTRSMNLHFADRVRADEQIVNYTLLQTIGPVVGFALGLFLMATYEATPEVVIAGYALAQTISMLIILPRIGYSLNATNPNREMIRDAFGYGMPIMLAGWLAWFSDHGIRFIVKYGMGMGAVGLLSVPWGLGRRSAAFTANLVNAAAFPLAVKKMKEGSRSGAMEQLAMNGAMLFGVLAPTVIGLWSINELLVKSLIDVRFAEVTIALLPLAVFAGGVRYFRAHYIDQIFLLDGTTREFLKIDMIESVSILVLCSLGIWYGDLWGATVGATAGIVIGAIVSYAYAYAAGGFHIMWEHFARIALACAAMALVLNMISFPIDKVGLAASIAIGGAVYVLVLAPFYLRELKEVLAVFRRSPSS